MGSACMQADAHLAHVILERQKGIVQHRLLNSLAFLVCNKGHAPGLVPAQQVPEGTALLRRGSMDHRQIFLFKASLPNLP